jgi:hypothetical protein
MLITADALLCHAIGDYLFQSDWMASTKTSRSSAALAHVITYTVPFGALTTSWKALLFIAATHFVIDRWRLARYVCWAKNFLAPRWIAQMRELSPAQWMRDGEKSESVVRLVRNLPWAECKATGYAPEKPAFMAVWLLIIADNVMHVLLNGVALRWL